MIDDVRLGSAQLLDVRTDMEWHEGHAEQALHIPVDAVLEGHLEQLVPGKKVYVYCRGGGRAGRAASYLKEKGFDAENIGGLVDWVQAGGKEVK